MQNFMVFLAALLLVVCNHVSGEIYKWVDEEGITHYSDTNHAAPENHQQVDDALPPVHSMDKPDAALTKIQRRAQKERLARNPEPARHRATTRRKKSPCASLQRQLRSVQAQLRRGYREPRGNKLRERRRNLEARLNDECR